MITVPDTIKDLLHLDTCKKNIRIHFPNGERGDICNDLIVKDSVSFTESLCSQSELKFGLCEAPMFECETVGVGNIKGATIEVFCEIYCEPSVSGAVWQNDLQHHVYQIPYGVFVVAEAKRQADMIHRRIVAYGGNYYINTEITPFERTKTSNTTSVRNYTPKMFHFALGNINARSYSDDIFSATEISSTGTDTLIHYSDTWEYEGHTLRAVFRWDRLYWNFSTNAQLQKLNNMYYLGMDRDFSKLRKDYDSAKTFLAQYGCTFTLGGTKYPVEALVKLYDHAQVFYTRANQSGTRQYYEGYYGAYFPTLFYPYENDTSRLRIFVPYNFRVEIEESGVVLYSEDYGNFVENLSLEQLTLNQDYTFLDSYTFTFPYSIDDDGSYAIDRSSYPGNAETLKAFAELLGVFVTSERDFGFDFVNIRQKFGLTPDSALYPGTSLYPQSVTGGKLLPQDYQSCWYEDDYTLPYGAIQCTYTDSNNDEYLYIYYLTGYDSNTNITTYKVYDFSDNEIIKNYTWDKTDIYGFCQQIASNIEGVTYMPVDFVGRGLPYVEAGDTFEILTASNDSITTIVLNKTTKGEQTLTDSYKSV